jgi:16S rRNA (guanine(966)-N(2))-methyltransferase RsmD
MPVMVKAAIFNLLRGHVESETVVDIFAGIGTMGLEAYSRGAARVVHVERDKRVLQLLRENIAALDADEVCEVLSTDALGPLMLARLPKQAHLIFADPPYALVRQREQYEKLRVQLGKLAQTLDDTGYLMMRVPKPLLFEVGEASATGEARPGKVRLLGDPNLELEKLIDDRIETTDAHAHQGGDRVVITSLDDPAWDELDTFESELFGADGTAEDDVQAADSTPSADQPAKPKGKKAKTKPGSGGIGADGVMRVPADLTLPGTIGPEIHTYGDMDVCLYMRDPDASD